MPETGQRVVVAELTGPDGTLLASVTAPYEDGKAPDFGIETHGESAPWGDWGGPDPDMKGKEGEDPEGGDMVKGGDKRKDDGTKADKEKEKGKPGKPHNPHPDITFFVPDDVDPDLIELDPRKKDEDDKRRNLGSGSDTTPTPVGRRGI